jgi:hypothetical protein
VALRQLWLFASIRVSPLSANPGHEFRNSSGKVAMGQERLLEVSFALDPSLIDVPINFG